MYSVICVKCRSNRQCAYIHCFVPPPSAGTHAFFQSLFQWSYLCMGDPSSTKVPLGRGGAREALNRPVFSWLLQIQADADQATSCSCLITPGLTLGANTVSDKNYATDLPRRGTPTCRPHTDSNIIFFILILIV